MAKAVMVQGAGSNVGKSLFVAGLGRAFVRRGLRVRPFKPQNMSNNAGVTADGGEIGRAQALQARACRAAPSVHMNPVLLKPESETGAQVVVQGQRLTTARARDYGKLKKRLLPRVLESFARICEEADLVLIEGAGSPAEINLRSGDIANMGFAEAAGVPVILLGDIDRGGVIAQMVGTRAVLEAADAARIRGFAVNKFRGDPGLFAEGMAEIAQRTGWQALGLVPWFPDAWRLPAEDVMDIPSRTDGTLPRQGRQDPDRPIRIAVPRLPRIANFDDLDPLIGEPGVCVEIIAPGHPLPGNADLVLIPGSKATIADLEAFRAEGWDIDLAAHLRRGGHVLGICGGYQMLGREIRDPHGIEGRPGTHQGLGLLDVITEMRPEKHLGLATARCRLTGCGVSGYEIHIGTTFGPDCMNPWLAPAAAPAGSSAATPGERVLGCYLHGIFASDSFRHAFLARLGHAESEATAHEARIEETLDALACHMEEHLDLDAILGIAARPAAAGAVSFPSA